MRARDESEHVRGRQGMRKEANEGEWAREREKIRLGENQRPDRMREETNGEEETIRVRDRDNKRKNGREQERERVK